MSDGNASRAAALLGAFSRYVEVAQPFFTRKDVRRGGSITPYRALIACSSISRCVSCVIFNAIPTRLGQPHPRLVIECPLRKQLDPLFISALDDEHRKMMYDVDPFIALGQFKEVVFRACTKAQLATLSNTPSTLVAKLLVGTGVDQPLLSNSAANLGNRSPSASNFVKCIFFCALCNIVESLTRDNIRVYEEELLGLDVNQAEKDMVRPSAPRVSKIELSRSPSSPSAPFRVIMMFQSTNRTSSGRAVLISRTNGPRRCLLLFNWRLSISIGELN